MSGKCSFFLLVPCALAILLAPDARSAIVGDDLQQGMNTYDPPRELRFPQGYEIVEEARSGARAIKTMPAGTANIAAWRDVDGARYYMTDWSFNRLVKEGIRPNWPRPFGGSPAPAASSPPATTSGSTSATYRIAGLPEGETLNIRSGPGTQHPVVAELRAGDSPVKITGPLVMNGDAEWAPIAFLGGKGWARTKYLAPGAAASAASASINSVKAEAGPGQGAGMDARNASRENPFVNSLGMKFVPVVKYQSGKRVLFSIWETRRQDYAAYAEAVNGVADNWKKGSGGYYLPHLPMGHEDDHPVVNVSWNNAQSFLAWLTRRERASGRIGPSAEYRLPTDLEWSVAAGIADREDASASPKDKHKKLPGVYEWGESYPPPKGAGNFADSAFMADKRGTFYPIPGYHDGFATSAPVGSFSPNRLGLYDLSGNISELCQDLYDPDDPKKHRVVRGEGYSCGDLDKPRLDRRGDILPEQYGDAGFRCVLVLPAP